MLYAITLFIKDLQLSYLNGTSHCDHPYLVRKWLGTHSSWNSKPPRPREAPGLPILSLHLTLRWQRPKPRVLFVWLLLATESCTGYLKESERAIWNVSPITMECRVYFEYCIPIKTSLTICELKPTMATSTTFRIYWVPRSLPLYGGKSRGNIKRMLLRRQCRKHADRWWLGVARKSWFLAKKAKAEQTSDETI